MARITHDLILKQVDARRWELQTEFDYHVGHEDSPDVVRVPKGFLTDLASTPKVLWPFFPPFGKYSGAALVHDWLYTTHIKRDRKEVDGIFLEAMAVLGVPWIKRHLMYRMVRVFGSGPWKSGYERYVKTGQT